MFNKIIISVCLFCCSTAFAQRPLGILTLGSSTTDLCPTGATCQNFTVTIPSVPRPAAGVLAIMNPSGSAATDVFFSVTNGSTWWGGMPTPGPAAASFFNSLISANHRVILVRWVFAWYNTPQGTPLGQLAASCRPATVLDWLRQHYPAESFNAIGTSAGSAAIAYSLANYPVFINRAVIDSGPPFMELAYGCENVPGYSYDDSAKGIVDGAYGFWSNGPCLTGNTQYESVWNTNSVENGANFLYIGTAVHIIIGLSDTAYIQNRGRDYYNLLSLNGQDVHFYPIPNMYHGVLGSADGISALLGILTSGTPITLPTPTPTATCFCP